MRMWQASVLFVQRGLNPYSNGRYSMRWPNFRNCWVTRVLILILMEDTLWDYPRCKGWWCACVLILILLEDTLWVAQYGKQQLDERQVLILILMEDTLWGRKDWYLCGVQQQVLILIIMEHALWVSLTMCMYSHWTCLNPYSNGRYSMSMKQRLSFNEVWQVLILILMEDTLWASKI